MKKLDNHLVEPLNAGMGFYFKSGKLLEAVQTPYQYLEVHEIPEYGRVLRLDGIFQTSDRDEFLYHEPLVHAPAITIDAPLKALVVGGGDGGSAEELLKYSSLEKVVMVELDAVVVQKSKKYLPNISKGAFDEARLELRIEDGMRYVATTKEKFDQIILDLTDAFGPSLELYTREFYASLKNILTPKGILSLHIESPIATESIFKRIYATLKTVFKHTRVMLNYVPLYGSLWAFAVASEYHDPIGITYHELKERISRYDLHDLKFYNARTHTALFTLPPYIQDMLNEPVPIITQENNVLIRSQKAVKLFLCEQA